MTTRLICTWYARFMQQDAAKKYCLAIDMGGTKIAAALVDSGGNVYARGRGKTPETLDAKVVVDSIQQVALQLLKENSLSVADMNGVGVSSAGTVTGHDGMVNSPNIAALRRTPLGSMLTERFGVHVNLGNDASLATLAEWQFGLNRSVDDLVYVPIGTGIGGGMVLAGKLYQGACGAAGEIGHMVIDANGPACPCGRHGCWESMASGRALGQSAAARISSICR